MAITMVPRLLIRESIFSSSQEEETALDEKALEEKPGSNGGVDVGQRG